jgi:hypothetical protein
LTLIAIPLPDAAERCAYELCERDKEVRGVESAMEGIETRRVAARHE